MEEGLRQRERRWQRLQWCAVSVAAVFLVLRLLLEGASDLTIGVLGVAGFAFGLGCLITSWRGTSDNLDQAYAARDAWKALSKVDRRELRRATGRRETIRPDLLGAAEVIARSRATQVRSLGWLGAGLAVMQLPQELPWPVVLAGPALVLAVVIAWLRGRVLDQYFAVLDQVAAAPNR